MAAREPLYLQIKTHLLEDIQAGRLRPGQRTPTELELCDRFSTTRATVRRAVDELVDENVLVRMGRRGTFVSRTPWERELNRFHSSHEDLVQRGLNPRTEVLGTEIVRPDRDVQRVLELGADAQVAHMRRLRFVGSEPLACLEDWIPIDLYRPLLGADLEHASLYRTFEEKTGQRIGSGRQTLGLARLSASQSRLLGAEPGEWALEMRAVCFSELGTPLIAGRYLFRGDGYRFTVTLRR